MLTLDPLSPVIGAVAPAFELSAAMTDAAIDGIRAALDRHLVVFFEDQQIAPREQRDLAARFGELYVHPVYPGDEAVPEIMVLQNDENKRASQNNWHTDVTYIEHPPQASLLLAEEVPAVGGDTMWASMYAAYEALSEPLQRLLLPLRAVHDFSKDFPPERIAELGGGAKEAARAYAENRPVSHPVVRTNLESGRNALFVNSSFTTHIEGVSRAESDALLRFLFEHVTRPEFQVRWRWKARDVALWDNRWTQHYALSDYFPNRRRMCRATILGDRPV